jgi:hypothetical protein
VKLPTSVYAFRISLDREGYVIIDQDGEAAVPERFNTWLAAAARLSEIVEDDIEATRQEQLP